MRKAEAESVPIIKKPVAFAPKKGRDRKSLKGSIGSVARASHARNALKEMTPTASAPSVMASVQPVSAARTSPQTSDSAPKETSPTPARVYTRSGPEALGELLRDEQGGHDADGNVQPEDPMPAQRLGDEPTHHWSGRHREPANASPDAHDGPALLRRKGRHQDG